MWFYYALFSAVLWGVGSVLVKKGHASFTPFGDNVIATIIQIFIVVPLLFLFLGVNLDTISSAWPYALLVAVLYMTYYYVISKGQISLTATVLSGYPLVTLILSFMFLGETLTPVQLLAVFMIIFGTVILALPLKIPKDSLAHPSKWLTWGIGGAVMVGFVQFFTKIGTNYTDGNTFTLLMGIFYVPALLLCALFDKKGRNIKKMKWKSSFISLIGVAMIELNLIPLNLAFSTGPASLVSAVTTLNSVIMVVLAVKFLKEHITKIQYLGIALTIAGTIIIGGA